MGSHTIESDEMKVASTKVQVKDQQRINEKAPSMLWQVKKGFNFWNVIFDNFTKFSCFILNHGEKYIQMSTYKVCGSWHTLWYSELFANLQIFLWHENLIQHVKL